MRSLKQFICIDIGGTAIKYGMIDENAEILERDKVRTHAMEEGGPGIVKKVRTIVADYLEKYGKEQISGICLSSAGMVDCDAGMIFHAGPTIPDYSGTRFKEMLEAEFGLPCELENDVNCAGLAEALGGAGRDAESIVCLTIGTGIGGCFIRNGQVYHGYSGSAMEVGYIQIDDSGKSFEQQGATSVLTRRVAELKGSRNRSETQPAKASADRIKEKRSDRWDGKRIFEAAKKGDVDCESTIDEMVRVLGRGIATICYLLNPETVVLGGGVMVQEEYLLPRIRAELDRELIPVIAEKTKLKAAAYHNEAGMVGAFFHFRGRHPELFRAETASS